MRRFDTLAVHAGAAPDAAFGALEPPVVLSNAFAFESAADAASRFAPGGAGHVYSRWRNPTVDALESKLAALEGAEDAVALASGMAAISAALLSNVKAGDHVVAGQSLYAESLRLLREQLSRFGVQLTLVDATDPEAIGRAVRPNTKVIYLETPANPTLAITDLRAARARTGGAVMIVDSTFATPYHQRPLEHGADLVVHSATKSLSGHGDALGGVVLGERSAVERARKAGVRTSGAALSPFSAMLIARGVCTLGLRMQRATANALELARRLESHPSIRVVHYPGLTSHPGHTVAARQMQNGFGALISFELEGGLDAGARCYDTVQLIARAVSLGDVRSLLTHPASTTHASMSAAQRASAGIGDGLMRLSVGIEDVEDIWTDLERALPSAP